jgi:hypothetical protein
LQAQEKACCSHGYEELKALPCDLDHYCNYIDWEEYKRVQTGGIVVTILMLVVMVSTFKFTLKCQFSPTFEHHSW